MSDNARKGRTANSESRDRTPAKDQKWIQQLGDVENEEMDRVFNLGVGLVLVVSNYYADNIQRILRREGLESWKLGEIKAGGTGACWA